MISLLTMGGFIFGPFTLSTHPPRLTHDGVEVRLRPRAFRTLHVLLQGQGAFVDHDMKIAEAWRALMSPATSRP